MYLSSFLSTLLLPLLAASTPNAPQHIFSNPASPDFKIPTPRESAILARRILHLTPLGTISTVFPEESKDQRRPADVNGLPIGLTEYISDCESSGNPTILAINIATPIKNAAAGSNVSLTVQWTPPYPPSKRIGLSSSPDPLPYSAAALPRFALLGYLEKISDEEVESQKVASCYTSTHPDAKYWLPGNDIHESEWVRLVVEEVYWFGGFGDRAYIGWIPIEQWRSVEESEWKEVRLPGEKKGWKEWATGIFGGEL